MKTHLKVTSLVLLLFGISSCRIAQTGKSTKPLAQGQTAESPADIIEQVKKW